LRKSMTSGLNMSRSSAFTDFTVSHLLRCPSGDKAAVSKQQRQNALVRPLMAGMGRKRPLAHWLSRAF
jgi:hypothetical protein